MRRLATVVVLLYALAVLLAGTRLGGISSTLALGLPLPVPQGAVVLAMTASLLVAGSTRGLLRGQRPIYVVVVALLAVSAVAHLLRRVDTTAAVLAVVLVAFLVVERDAFRARVPLRPALVRVGGLLLLVVVSLAGALALSAVLAGLQGRRPDLDAVLDWSGVPAPARLAVTFTLLVLATALGWALTTPDEPAPPSSTDDPERARALVRSCGEDSLDYFALRSDRVHVTVGQGLVSYAVVDGYCLVAPTPIGKDAAAAWWALREHAARQGWPVAVVGVSEAAADALRDDGMTVVYTGDEAVVHVGELSLEGRRHRSLRQAVNRVRRHGYTSEVVSSSRCDGPTRARLHSIAPATRRGSQERGFAMTLGRIADPADDTVLVLIRDSAGVVSAFCQFVPGGPGQWSLDVMRRDGRPHPNGLMELALVDFFAWVAAAGGREVSLNFAPLRLVLEGEASVRPLLGLDRWLLARVGERTQMASLHRFNAKFEPHWRPRFAAVDGAEYLLPASIAWLRAEGIDELPLAVRLLLRVRA